MLGAILSLTRILDRTGPDMSTAIDKLIRDARRATASGQGLAARAQLLAALTRFPANQRLAAELVGVQAQVSGLPGRAFGRDHVARLMRIKATTGIAAAIEDAEIAVRLCPASAFARGVLGALMIEARRPADAIPALRAALKIDPAYLEAAVNLATALRLVGQAAAAVTLLDDLLTRRPDFAPALDALAAVSAIVPGLAMPVWARLANQRPDDVEVLFHLSGCQTAMQEFGAAAKTLRRMLSIAPGDVRALNNLGNIELDAGRIDAAAGLFDAAIHAAPRSGRGYYNLGRAVDFAPGDPRVDAMRALAKDPALPTDDRVPLLFGLAKALEDQGDVDESFAHLNAGNDLRRSGIDYSTAADAALLDDLRARFPASAPGLGPQDCADAPRRAIFIVGMMRSGTTLLEQILSSHSAVHGAGELDHLGAALEHEVAQTQGPLGRDALLRIRTAYLSAIAALPGNAPVVVDKMPANFRFVGLIRKALPEARILHMRRDPVAVCWSIYKTLFTNARIGYAWRLDEVAAYHDLYVAFMADMQAQYPGAVLDVDYKALTETPEPVIRAVLDHCGLPFEVACLSPQDNTRAIRTASLRQVRSGIYTGSTSRWKGFERHLAPLITHFNATN